MIAYPEVGQVLDLSVRFGSQTRTKCAFCTRYARRDDDQVACRCGAIYTEAEAGLMRVLVAP